MFFQGNLTPAGGPEWPEDWSTAKTVAVLASIGLVLVAVLAAAAWGVFRFVGGGMAS